MTTWVVEDKRTWPEWLALKVLQVGPIPSHVAFIMDGNRRFAKQRQQKALHGHVEGFKTLGNVLSWCRDLCINEVTVYAFSIENFNRSKEEVDGLMALATEKFEQLLKEKDKLAEHGLCIRIVGDLDLFPEKLRSLAAQAVLATKNNSKYFLNLAMAYTSRYELTDALKLCATAVTEEKLKSSDITTEFLESCLYTSSSKHPDMVIRTSGETRLSDFLLWQSQFSYLFFTKVLWPELSIWHVFGAIFDYQRHHHMLLQTRKQIKQLCSEWEHQNYLEECLLDECQDEETAAMARLSDAIKERDNRVTSFLEDLQEKRLQHLHHLAAEGVDCSDSKGACGEEHCSYLTQKESSFTKHFCKV